MRGGIFTADVGREDVCTPVRLLTSSSSRSVAGAVARLCKLLLGLRESLFRDNWLSFLRLARDLGEREDWGLGTLFNSLLPPGPCSFGVRDEEAAFPSSTNNLFLGVSGYDGDGCGSGRLDATLGPRLSEPPLRAFSSFIGSCFQRRGRVAEDADGCCH